MTVSPLLNVRGQTVDIIKELEQPGTAYRDVSMGGLCREAAIEIASLRAAVEVLREKVSHLAPFLAVWADRYQRDYGLDGFHPVHYDLLLETGIRMESFKRATNAPLIGGLGKEAR